MKLILGILLTLSIFIFILSRLEIYTIRYDFEKEPERIVFFNLYDITIAQIGIVDEECRECIWSNPYTTIYSMGYEIEGRHF